MASTRKRWSAGVAALGLAFGLAACGGGSSDGGTDTPAKSDAITVPDKIKDRGVLNVATFYNYPPYTEVKNGKLTGIEYELMTAVAGKLGLKAKFNDLQFEAMIPSIVNGRNDVMIGSLADTEERRKEVGFVDLYKTALSVLVKKGNKAGVDSQDLCGDSASLAAGSFQLLAVQDISKKCEADGKRPIKIITSADPGAAFLAVVNGRTELTVQDPAVAKSTVASNADLELVTGVLEIPEQSSGWVFAKDDQPLRLAFVQAINELVKDGTWQKIMDKAGLGEVALVPPTINLEPAA